MRNHARPEQRKAPIPVLCAAAGSSTFFWQNMLHAPPAGDRTKKIRSDAAALSPSCARGQNLKAFIVCALHKESTLRAETGRALWELLTGESIPIPHAEAGRGAPAPAGSTGSSGEHRLGQAGCGTSGGALCHTFVTGRIAGDCARAGPDFFRPAPDTSAPGRETGLNRPPWNPSRDGLRARNLNPTPVPQRLYLNSCTSTPVPQTLDKKRHLAESVRCLNFWWVVQDSNLRLSA